MNIHELQSGLYRLTVEVKNPRPDGRKRGDWKAAKVFPPGVYAVHVSKRRFQTTSIGDVRDVSVTLTGEWRALTATRWIGGQDRDSAVAALAECLEPIPTASVGDALDETRQGSTSRDLQAIFEWLIANTTVTLEDVATVLRLDRDDKLDTHQ